MKEPGAGTLIAGGCLAVIVYLLMIAAVVTVVGLIVRALFF